MRRKTMLIVVATIMSAMVAANAGLASASEKAYVCEPANFVGMQFLTTKEHAKELEKSGNFNCWKA